MDGYRTLDRGQNVSFRAKASNQHGFAYRAVKVWTGDIEPVEEPRARHSADGYSSTLTLTFDPSPPDGVSPPQA